MSTVDEALAALYSEALPTGRFGNPRPGPSEPAPDPLAAVHRADLLAELGARAVSRRRAAHNQHTPAVPPGGTP